MYKPMPYNDLVKVRVWCMNSLFLKALVFLVLLPSFTFCAAEAKTLNADIQGINPKTVVFSTEDAVHINDEFQVVRGSDVIALVKVIKMERHNKNSKSKEITAEIVQEFSEIGFDDTLLRFSKPTPPPEEKKENPPETKKEETPVVATDPSVIPSETKPNEESVSDSVSKEKQTEVPAEEPKEPATVIPSEAKESQKEKPEDIANAPETPAVIPSEEAPKPQTFGVAFGYSLFVPKDFKVSNNGFRGEARVKLPTVKNLYGALSYAQHTWTDKTTELKLNVLSVNLAYSLKPFLPQTFSFINDVQLAAGYSNLSSRLTQDATTLTKSASGFNTGIALRMLKFLNIDYRFHSFTLDFPNGKIKNGEQVAASFSYSF